MTELTDEQARGRWLVSAWGLGVIFFAVVWFQVGLMSGVGAPIAQELFRILLFASLFYFAHRGRSWARLILIVVLFINGAGGVAAGTAMPEMGWMRWVMVASSLVYLAAGAVLAFSRDVREFMTA